jgi:hypothetical protein
MDSYTMRDNKFVPALRKNIGTSHLILDIYFRIVSILITPVKVHPVTAYDGPEREQKYRFTPSVISTLDGVGGQRHAPAALPRERDPIAIVQEAGWAPKGGLDGVHKALSHRDAIRAAYLVLKSADLTQY